MIVLCGHCLMKCVHVYTGVVVAREFVQSYQTIIFFCHLILPDHDFLNSLYFSCISASVLLCLLRDTTTPTTTPTTTFSFLFNWTTFLKLLQVRLGGVLRSSFWGTVGQWCSPRDQGLGFEAR